MIVEVIRHALSNDSSIADYAARLWQTVRSGDIPLVTIESTPHSAAVDTARKLHEHTKDWGFTEVREPAIDSRLGAYGQDASDVVHHLYAEQMVRMWGILEDKTATAQHAALEKWCAQGFDKQFPNDPGITLREVARGISAYVHDKITNHSHSYVVAIGHSGDIESHLYMVLKDSIPSRERDPMVAFFDFTGGALEPLSGIKYDYSIPTVRGYTQPVLMLEHCMGTPRGERKASRGGLNPELLEQHATWFNANNRREEVLKAKTAQSEG